MSDLADADPAYRCVMKDPPKKYVLRVSHTFMVFYQFGSVMGGIGATRSASSMRRNGYVDMVWQLRNVVNFSGK